ncbi:methyltransferase domain-containing protein [Lipingzhangella sp. LS1_29]|uniref:Methyltransferase domain-containing protein n=1 Tax=Lipingzhangella rawalii TaxID=2055835 RepID=A0ABU2H2U5_9ACTN|nr:methyltransferase domain-containing protein [Lipingzhangella rawalii]MDS1269621.1 methyltransferase domain-containing protein [Lipingzhangella rawalii]
MTQAETFDPRAYKQALQQEWQDAAPGWRRWVATMETDEGGQGMSRKLVELADVGPGHAVLDVGAGYAEPGVTVVNTIAPGGRLTLQDLSAPMLAFARERVAEAAAGGVEVDILEGDIETLALPEAYYNAVVSRSALMYAVDVVGVLGRLRATLRPAGRLAASVWGPPEQVGFAASLSVMLDELQLPPPPKDRPGPFALGDPERLAALVAHAGFTEVNIGSRTLVWEFASRQACTQFLRDVAPPVTALVADRPEDVRQRVWQRVTSEAWEPFAEPDGRVRLPNRALWVAATNPA